MAKKNYRCPLQDECERSCKWHGHELECQYYHDNARDGYVIDDQEELRREREREWAEQFFENLIEDEERAEQAAAPTGGEDGDQSAKVGKLVMLSVDKIHPHPDNPRKDLGDLTELAESIKANGVLQNLTVVKRYGEISKEFFGTYTVIIGHRRLAASKLAGLTEVPCVIVDMTPAEQFATMMVENVQRSDLTVYEQAQGFQTMLDLGGTVEEVARQTGFSQTTVRNRLKLMKLDSGKLQKSMSRNATLQDYMELDKIEDEDRRNKVLDSVGTENFRAELKKALAAEATERKIAHWESLVSSFARKVNKRPEIMDSSMVKQFTIHSSKGDESYDIPEDAYIVDYQYFVDPQYGVYLYKPKERDPEEDLKEQERKEAAERFNRRKAEFEEISDLHQSLREEFLMEFTPTKREHKEAIERYAVHTMIGIQAKWARVDWIKVGDLLNIDAVQEGVDEYEFADVLRYNPARALLAVAYSFESWVMSGRYWENSYSSKGIIHRENDRLDALYALLTTLGYEMSDEELQMQKGTHELFYHDEE